MSTLKERRKARRRYEKARKSKLGSGKRFKALEEIARLYGASNPSAVAAYIGRKKYGTKKFAKLSLIGKRRKKRKR